MTSSRAYWIVVCALLVHGQPASARLITVSDDDFDTLVRKADVVVIGHVLAIKETPEETTLPNIAPPVQVRGVETRFFADSVLKGEVSNRVVVLHHYALRDPSQRFRSGPLLVRFVVNAHRHYLMFLQREPDGRYAPAGGQTDAAFSLRRIMGAFDGLSQMAKEDRTDRGDANRQPKQIVESPDAPVVFRFESMEATDGVRKVGRMRVINTTSKDIIGYKLEALFFKEDGSVADSGSSATRAAIGHVVLRGNSEIIWTIRGQYTDNYETSRAEAVATSVDFADGTKWEAAGASPISPTVPQTSSTRPSQE